MVTPPPQKDKELGVEITRKLNWHFSNPHPQKNAPSPRSWLIHVFDHKKKRWQISEGELRRAKLNFENSLLQCFISVLKPPETRGLKMSPYNETLQHRS